MALFEQWGIGKRHTDNGILFLVARDERQVRIEVGYGLEGDLTDAESNVIIQRDILPAFRTGNYADGIGIGVDMIMAAIDSNEAVRVAETVPSKNNNDFFGALEYALVLIFWLGSVLFQWLSAVLARSKSWWAGGLIGAAIGVLAGFVWGFLPTGLLILFLLTPLGLLLDYKVSHAYIRGQASGSIPWWAGGRSRHWGGGFGGFGGGLSGGGGASGRW